MAETPGPDARFKARIDLWIHSNNTMWSRLQPLYFLQLAYFAISVYLSSGQQGLEFVTLILLTAVLLISFFFQGTLLFLVLNEQNDRNIQGELLVREFGFDPTEYSRKGRALKYGFQDSAHNRFWAVRHAGLFAVFGSWMFIDLGIYIYIIFGK
jgi:hypothetical protein